MKLFSRLPVLAVGDATVAITLDRPLPDVGDQIELIATDAAFTLIVESIDLAPANGLAAEVLSLFGFDSHEALHHALEATYGPLRRDSELAVLVLTEQPGAIAFSTSTEAGTVTQLRESDHGKTRNLDSGN